MLFNVVTIVIALGSLVVAIGVALRQHRNTINGYIVPIVLNAFAETRSPGFFEAQEYLVGKLRQEHKIDFGVRGLPSQVRDNIRFVGLFYDDLGKLIAHKVIEPDVIIGSYGTNILNVWEALHPFIAKERELRSSRFFIYFEDLAARVAENPPSVMHSKVGLREFRPRSAAPSAESADGNPPSTGD